MRKVNGFEIRNDCPPPTHYGRYSKWLSVLNAMKIGEYIDVDTADERDSFVQSAKSTRYNKRKSGSQVEVFVRTQRQGRNGKYRIWRVES